MRYEDPRTRLAVASRPSPHFTWDEVACWNRLRNARGEPTPFEGVPPGALIAPYPIDWRDTRLVGLLDACETIRAWWARPIVLSSCYRTPAYNAAIGGASTSQHLFGRAADLHRPAGLSPQEFYDRIRAYAVSPSSGSPIRGIGWYPWGVHIDLRPSQVIRFWRSDRPGAELVALARPTAHGEGERA